MAVLRHHLLFLGRHHRRICRSFRDTERRTWVAERQRQQRRWCPRELVTRTSSVQLSRRRPPDCCCGRSSHDSCASCTRSCGPWDEPVATYRPLASYRRQCYDRPTPTRPCFLSSECKRALTSGQEEPERRCQILFRHLTWSAVTVKQPTSNTNRFSLPTFEITSLCLHYRRVLT